MKKIISFILICMIMIIPFFCIGCKSNNNEELNFYDIVICYDDTTQMAVCEEKVSYVNLSENAFDTLYFHIYPKAFSQGSKNEVVSKALKEKAYYEDNFYGDIEIQSVKIASDNTEFDVDEEKNILKISLFESLYPDERVSLVINFLLTLPHINHRFGYGDTTINFGNFYPIACVYENGQGFQKDAYLSNGDPFYSDISNYCVTINYDEKFLLASSGDDKLTTYSDGKKHTKVIANKVRDFCFVLSEKFLCKEQSVDGINVKYFYYNDQEPEKSLQTSCQALQTFNNMFGKYPYKELSVVEANFVHGGMEYPNLVLISDDITDYIDYQYVIVHEIGHQWWYGVVGNNEFDEAWVDESLTEYSTFLFFEQNPQYGLRYDELIKNANSSYKFFLSVYQKIYDNFDTSMNRRLDEFKTEPEYVNLVYTKGVLMYDAIRNMVGDKKFKKALEKYFEKYKFMNVKGDDLIEIFEKYTSKGIRKVFESWLNGEVVIV